MLLLEPVLTAGAIRRLVYGEALAVRIPRYHPPDLCEKLLDPLLSALDAEAFQRIYRSNVPAFTESAPDSIARRRYLDSTARVMSVMRDLCRPYASPVDRLRCELDELWPGGAKLLRHRGDPLVFGMLRVWSNGAQALPHRDVLGLAAPEVPEARSFTEQLGVNLYLGVPDRPGEGAVEVWNTSAGGTEHGIEGTYGYRRELLPAPAVVVHPEPGDLLLLRSTRVHAVRPTSAGRRVTLSGFIGHRSAETPLQLWS
jgi:2OG-Fe(II) oxygenase superfamily